MWLVLKLVIAPLFQLSNYIEAGFWIALGIGFAGGYFARKSRICAAAAPTLVAFGISDIVEAQTGAWYDPWWLLLWKAACLVVLLFVLVLYLRTRRASR